MSRIADRSAKMRYLIKRDGPACHYCGKRIFAEEGRQKLEPDERITLDHIVPKSKGGGSHLENFVLSCPSCNQWKGAKGADFYRDHCKRCRARFDAVAARKSKKSSLPRVPFGSAKAR